LLPRQHSLKHYCLLIQLFGAPNGLCSSITESKHIKAVKEPWRCSSRNEPLGQMLLTNQRLDKLAAAHADFQARGMLRSVQGNPLTGKRPIPALHSLESDNHNSDLDAEDDDRITLVGDVWFPKKSGKYIQLLNYMVFDYLLSLAARGYPKTLSDFSTFVEVPQLVEHVRRFSL
jgi:hypothetical protein